MEERIERAIARASARAYFAGKADQRDRWKINCARVQKLKAMRSPERVRELELHRMARVRHD